MVCNTKCLRLLIVCLCIGNSGERAIAADSKQVVAEAVAQNDELVVEPGSVGRATESIAESATESAPSLELLEFLGQWETDEGEWISPSDLADENFVELIETVAQQLAEAESEL